MKRTIRILILIAFLAVISSFEPAQALPGRQPLAPRLFALPGGGFIYVEKGSAPSTVKLFMGTGSHLRPLELEKIRPVLIPADGGTHASIMARVGSLHYRLLPPRKTPVWMPKGDPKKNPEQALTELDFTHYRVLRHKNQVVVRKR